MASKLQPAFNQHINEHFHHINNK